MANKGGGYEREISKMLSRWWTGDPEQDDCFWRSSQSGGRATVRRRKGKGTRGHAGDICATDSVGEPLVKLITFELKKGYSKACVGQVVDRPTKINQQAFESFIEQAHNASKNAGTPYWAIIHKRDSRQSIIYVPTNLVKCFISLGCHFELPLVSVQAPIKLENKSWEVFSFTAMLLEAFLGSVDPQDVRHLLQRLQEKSRR